MKQPQPIPIVLWRILDNDDRIIATGTYNVICRLWTEHHCEAGTHRLEYQHTVDDPSVATCAWQATGLLPASAVIEPST